MKNKILFILVLVLLFSFNLKVSASGLCSSKGYTVLTINGIFTDETGAIKNKNSLKNKFSSIYNNQPLAVDYLYNPTHLGGAGDIIDYVRQGFFNEKSDYTVEGRPFDEGPTSYLFPQVLCFSSFVVCYKYDHDNNTKKFNYGKRFDDYSSFGISESFKIYSNQ